MNFCVRSLGLVVTCLLVVRVSPATAGLIPFLKPQELIQKQAPPVINRSVYDRLGPDNATIVVSLSRQRVYVMAGQDVAIDSPVSSGKHAGMTPTGDFTIVQKDKDHRSNVYGNFVDAHGRVVRAGVSAVIDAAPSGTHFEGAPMSYFMRITWEGVGLHVGILPGYAASHGCIRLPREVAQATFVKVRVGTPVRVAD
ncbi:MAG TPA: L,D-transpeptidase family protein [Chthoniobacterales bacterium]